LAEKQKYSHIADDPFAGDRTSSEVQQFGEVLPKGNAGRWVTNADYPAAAMREEREGKVGFTLDVSPEGRITKCAISSSSGHADLDSATCVLLQRRGRFHPTKSGGSYSNVITWSIPR
jgi:protein TonB